MGKLLKICVAILGIALLANSNVQAAASVTFYHRDALGSVIATSDQDGYIDLNEEYQPYGEKIYQAEDFNGGNEDWYTGKNFSKELDLTYFGARWYDAKQGRFLSMDPAPVSLTSIHSFNRYVYVANNPYKYTDPDGEELESIIVTGGDSRHPIQKRTYLVDKKVANNATKFASEARKKFSNLSLNNAFRLKSSEDIDTRNTQAKVSRHQGGFALDFNGVGNLSIEERGQLDEIASKHGFAPATDREADLPHYSADPTNYGYDSLNSAIQENKTDYNKNFKSEVPNLYE